MVRPRNVFLSLHNRKVNLFHARDSAFSLNTQYVFSMEPRFPSVKSVQHNVACIVASEHAHTKCGQQKGTDIPLPRFLPHTEKILLAHGTPSTKSGPAKAGPNGPSLMLMYFQVTALFSDCSTSRPTSSTFKQFLVHNVL